MRTTITCLLVLIGVTTYAQDTDKRSWLIGTWSGPGFGGTFEEVWSPPDSKGTMMGMFRYIDGEDNVQFYEFWLLDSTGMKLKHFNPDFSGWEEKSDFVDFEMIEVTDKKVALNGLSYELLASGELEIKLRLKNGEAVKNHVFQLKRK